MRFFLSINKYLKLTKYAKYRDSRIVQELFSEKIESLLTELATATTKSDLLMSPTTASTMSVLQGLEISPSKLTFIKKISNEKQHVVFMLWGAYAQKKGSIIDEDKHLVLKAAHPSPFSAYQGFFGCKHFSKANEYLVKHGKKPIEW